MIIFRETFWNTHYWEQKGLEYWLDSLYIENLQWQAIVPAFLIGICFAFFVYVSIKMLKLFL